MSQPHFGQVWGWSPTLPKLGIWSPPRLPNVQSSTARPKIPRIEVFLVSLERSWSVDIENGLACIGHLNICSPSYGEKKGRESNWQFDSRPLKVWNQAFPDLRIESSILRWKDLGEGYKFGSDLVTIRLCSRELWAPKVPGLHSGQFRDNFGTSTWESREKVIFGRECRGESQSIL